jgi:hypothetical protein
LNSRTLTTTAITPFMLPSTCRGVVVGGTGQSVSPYGCSSQTKWQSACNVQALDIALCLHTVVDDHSHRHYATSPLVLLLWRMGRGGLLMTACMLPWWPGVCFSRPLLCH